MVQFFPDNQITGTAISAAMARLLFSFSGAPESTFVDLSGRIIVAQPGPIELTQGI